MAKIRMYSTAVCPFCLRAEMLLGSKGVTEIEKIRVDLDPRQREEMMNRTGRRTVPQIYIGDTHVGGFEELAYRGLRHMPIAAELVRERAHVAGALYVVLAAQRIDANALAAEVARCHREVRDADNHRRTLAVLCDTQPVVDGRICACGV